MTTSGAILLVEDNSDDVFLMQRALKAAGITNPLYLAEDGEQAVEYLSGQGAYSDRAAHPFPSIVFLDLKLPLKNGLEVLRWIRSKREFETLVVVILTSSNEPSDLREAYRLGTNSYLVKPPTANQLLDMAKAFKWYWLEYNKFPEIGARP